MYSTTKFLLHIFSQPVLDFEAQHDIKGSANRRVTLDQTGLRTLY